MLALVCALAGPAAAAPPIEALRMAWDDCQISPGSVVNKGFGCDTNIGAASLFCGFSVAEPIDQVIALEIVVDIQHSQATLPDWWRLGPWPDCRHDLLTASVDFSSANECESPGFSGALVQDYLITEPRGLNSQARIKAVVYVPSPATISLGTDTTYHAVRLALGYDQTVNINVCSGCTPSACLVLNSILVRRTAGAPGGDILLTTPGPSSANWAYWRSSGGPDCNLVPVRAVTWGRVKSMYR